MASKEIVTRVVINGIDHMSKPISAGVDKSISSLSRLEKKSQGIASKSFSVGRTSAGISAALAAPLIYAGKQAVEFEDQMADVAKVTNTAIGSGQFEALSNEVKDLSGYLAVSAKDASGLYAALAQGGVAREDLKEISRLAGQVGVAFGMSSTEAGDSFIKIQNALGTTIKQTALVTDAVNELSDKTAASAGQLLSFLSAGGAGVARGYGLMGQEVAAIGAAFISVGKSGEEAATITERFAKGIMASAKARAIYSKAGGGLKGFEAVLQTGAVIKNQEEQFKYFRQFGEYGNDVRLLAQNMSGPGGLASAVRIVADEQVYGGSVAREFSNRQKTTLTQLRREWFKFQGTIIDVGTNMLPIIKDVAADLGGIAKGVGLWAKANPGLTTTIIKTTAALAGFSAVVSGIAFLTGGLATSFGVLAKFGRWIAGTGVITAVANYAEGLVYAAYASGSLSVASLGAAAAITGVGVALVLAYKYITPFQDAVDKLWISLQSLGDHAPAAWEALKQGDFGKLMKISAAADLQTKVNWYPTEIKRRREGRRENELMGQPVPASIPEAKAITANGTPAPNSSYMFNPTLNISVPGGSDTKKIVDDALLNAQQRFEKQMKEYERNKLRRAF